MIVFENEHEIDVRSISTFGVSVKAGDNPIGFFGTGLKYAIAVLLRTNHEVTIFSGESVIQFGICKNDIRGQEFEFVTMATDGADPVEIGFTTELGKQWEVWMAYREIACNCKDESGVAAVSRNMPLPQSGRTAIIVKGQEFESVFADRHLYMLEDDPSFVIGTMEVRRRESQDYFYRSVRVQQLGHIGMYTYNDNQQLELTEDRTVKNQWQPMQRIACAALKCTDERFLRAVLTAPDDTVEGNLDFHGWGVKPGECFLRIVGELASDRATKINPTALKVWKESGDKNIKPKEVNLTRVQQISVDRALDFCEKIGFMIRGSYPIKIVESLGEGTLGLAQDEIIFIAERVFHLGGTKQLASTLIEEYLHLRHGYTDCSRGLQSFLFEKLVSVGEELVGEPL